jgi:predicted metal-binding protein
MDDLVTRAVKHGFSHAALLDVSMLRARSEVRDMCGSGKCNRYGKNWRCPPACGSIEENARAMSAYRTGLIVQTTGEMEDDFDYESMEAAGQRQKELFISFGDELAGKYPGMLALGNGTCTICAECTYPDAPCVAPERSISSMEAFGLVVSDVCLENGLGYYYGPRTITYTGCYLLQ